MRREPILVHLSYKRPLIKWFDANDIEQKADRTIMSIFCEVCVPRSVYCTHTTV